MCEGVYKPVEIYFQSTRSMVLGVLGVALCVSGYSGYLQSLGVLLYILVSGEVTGL